MSRMLSGKSRPSLKTICKMIDSLDIHAGSQLLAAYLIDDIPAKLRPYVFVVTRNGQKEFHYKDPVAEKLEQLDAEKRTVVESVIDALLPPQK